MSIDELKSEMQKYFLEKKNGMQARVKALKGEGKEEEAKFELSRLDVYDIFGTMLETSALKVKMNPKYADADKEKAFVQEYLMTFISKPGEWRKNYSHAKESGQEEQMKLEEIHLSTVNEIREKFLELSRSGQ